ncbi:MlaE family ABC transporter permease [Desulfobacca acetoxidans]|uniref:ABC transporter permease n=1 Tax=Desulfobacca acetoxidans (strain ATCC 700848 / DSM 11109 / ASRB2) TaxID=880072 RepID=F2NCS8_DESAR|nr:MlaE family lipid ABC transporter permease subunit [Desulfobacca acetoxidans]AEB09359.1 protein of unknown function DUF140 [Desulfobacca acetoxidans DSM 11109]
MKDLLRTLGRATIDFIQEAGRMQLFLFQTLGLFFLPPYKPFNLVKQVYVIGVRSSSIILLTAMFTGMVLGLQGYYTLRKFGAESALGSAVALSLIRELGPVLTALMVTGRAGSAITAEIGIMRITEQLDALDTMAINPMQYVVMPKVIAGLIAVPLLTAFFDFVGIVGGYLVGVVMLGVSSGSYFSGMIQSVETLDVNGGFVKSIVFGLTVTLVACYKGYFTSHGAEGVSQSTTEAVVLAAILILGWDYVLTSFFM